MKLGLGLGVAAVAGILSAPASQAGMLTLELGGITTIVDNGVGDLDPAVNQVTFSGSVGDMETQVTVGVSNSPGDSSTGALLSLTSLSINNAGGSDATLRIRLTDTDYSLPFSGTQLDSSLSASFVNDSATNSITLSSYADDSNIAFGTANAAPGLNLPITGGVSSSAPVSLTGPYSITSVVDISLAGGSVLTATGNSVVIPEPGTLLLAAGGLGLIASRRRAAISG